MPISPGVLPGVIDKGRAAVNAPCMASDPFDLGAVPRPGDLLADLIRQDLDPLSVAELEARITALQGEIARCQARMARAVDHRASADELFRK